MKKLTNYAEIATEIVSTIKKNRKIGLNNGDTVKDLEKRFNLKVSDILDGTKGRYTRMLFKLFGIMINNGVIILLKDADKNVLNIISQIEPLTKYFSNGFIAKMIKKVNSEKDVSYEQDSISKFVAKLSSKNELTDYILSLVSDAQCDMITKKNKTDKNENTDSTNSNKEAALKEELHRLKKQIEKRNVSTGSDELFLERLEDSILSVAPSLKFINEPWRGDKTFNHNETATEVLHISDWHIGETDNIGGFNKFNYKIACDRVKTLTNKVISWTKMHRSMYKVDELVIIATGDMISGDIHDELRATNEFPAPEQCVKSGMLISKMVNELSAIFKKVRVEYIVHDNHSRTTKKIEFAPGTNSYNYIVGMISKMMLRDNETVEFNVYPEIQHVIQVDGLKYLITHGNSIRGGFAGIPYYGMNRKLGAEALIRMNMPEEAHFNRIVMGHYHTPFMNNGVEMTGCLSSTTAFDHAAGRHSPACQTAWLVSKKFEMDYSIFWLS